MNRPVPCTIVGVWLLLGSAAEAAQVQFVWSGTVPLAGVGVLTLTNPNVSPGETWTLTYELDNTIPDSDPSLSGVSYTDPALTPTIAFSGGYSTPVSTAPGIAFQVLNGTLSFIDTQDLAGDLTVRIVIFRGPIPNNVFPPDGIYAHEFSGGPLFSLVNADGEISYVDTLSPDSVTVTTIAPVPLASPYALVLLTLGIIATGCGVLKHRERAHNGPLARSHTGP